MASRLFRTTTFRPQIPLGGFWDFVTDPSDQGEKLDYAVDFPRPETRLWVPGTWNSYARYWHYEGAAWFRRSFEAPAEGLLRIRFGGVFYTCKVWLDGNYLGSHEGGYSPFVLTKPIARGHHSLVVRADNRLSEDTLPKAGVDWFPYGGIHRPVYAELVPAVHIDNFHVITESLVEEAHLTVRAQLQSSLSRKAQGKLVFEINGREAVTTDCEVNSGKSEVSLSVVIKEPLLWSPDQPYLYYGRLVLSVSPLPGSPKRANPGTKEGLIVDDQITRFGLRKFELAGSRIFLNGKPFKLRGANHHDDHPEWGSALPPNIIRQDIEILKRLGTNAARGHYPPDEIFMDYCDQAGLVFMSEIPAWQYNYAQLSSPVIQEKMRAQFAEMVFRDMNRPSVFSWSLGNEWREFEKCHTVVESLVAYTRRLDPTRFITYVTGGAGFASGTALLDLICTNWAQYHWYDPFTTLDDQEGRKNIALLERLHANFPDKPVIITEFGAAEAQAGWHNWGNVKWSEEFQARSVADSAKFGLETPWIAGGCVWQFCDVRSAPSRFLAGRLRGWNGKGVVDEYRSPKMAFYKLQEIYRDYEEGHIPKVSHLKSTVPMPMGMPMGTVLFNSVSRVESGKDVPLRMEVAAWKQSLPQDSAGRPDHRLEFTWGEDPMRGEYLEIGPWYTGRGNECARFDHIVPLDATEGQVRGWYRTVGLYPYTAEVSILFQVPGKRPPRQTFSLGPSDKWSPFALPIRRAPAGARAVVIGVGLRRPTDGQVQFAGLSISTTPFRVEFPEEPGLVTRPEPPSPLRAHESYRIVNSGDAWWLVSPEGRPFYSTGTDGPRIPASSSEGERRISEDGAAYLLIMRSLGFNSLAGWTDLQTWGPINEVEMRAGRPPLAAFLSLQTGSMRGEFDRLSTRPGHPFPDPFDPRWEAAVRTAVRRRVALVRNSPWFVGFFADNEIDHTDLHRHVYTPHCSAALQRFLERRYGEISRLNDAWGTEFASFDDLIAQKPDPVLRYGAMYDDFRLFKREIVRRYVDTVLRVIRAEAPGRLVFSSRFMLGDVTEWMDVLDLYRPFDAIGVNMYPANLNAGLNRNEQAVLELVPQKNGRPILIPEWSVPALDSGLYNNPDKLDWSYQETVDTQQERARQTAKLMIDFYNLPYVIGAHWFIWKDFDSEKRQANRGLFKASGEPWVELQKAIAKTNRLIAAHMRGSRADPIPRVSASPARSTDSTAP